MLVNLAFYADRATGLATYTRQVLPYLQPLAPTLLAARPQPGFKHQPIPDNLSADRGSRGHLRRLLWTQFRLPLLYRHLQADLLFAPIPEAPLSAGCRSAVMVHDTIPLRYPNPKSNLRFYHRYWLPRVARQAVRVICNSEATARDIVQFLGVPASRIETILLAYDRDRFRPLAPSTLPPAPARPYFLYLGRHNPYKNLAHLIAAFARVAKTQDCELRLAGPTDPRYTPQLRAQVAEWGLGDRVQFLDYVADDQLPILLNQTLALVFPSRWEGFGLPVLEAMACGTPAIASNVSSLPEVAGEAALLIDPENLPELADAMQQVATDGELRRQLRDRGLARAAQFSWAQTGEATAAVLQACL